MIAMKKNTLLPGLVAILVALLLVFSFLLVCTSVLHAAKPAPAPTTGGVLTGKVTNAATLKIIVGATVTAVGSPGSYSAVTNSKGVYSISLPAGDYQITARATGMADLTVARTIVAGVTTTVNFALTTGVASTLPHASRISSYNGPQTCLGCHGTAIADQVFAS
ncbi:MAG: carboxypeptidase regulatory-like domain-containing protein, partial [Desulfuromonadales bacterium]|nr:carboxypeptidase regulatory-like domain-containing protein [Desulfuromonadales bacterium]